MSINQLESNLQAITQTIAQLKKEYIAKYLKIIPPRKVLDVQHAEDRFQREIIKKMARENNNKKETPNN